MRSSLLLLAYLGELFTSSSRSAAQDRKPMVPSGVRYEEDLVYSSPGTGKPLLLDVARPTVGKGPYPTVVLIPGGGWLSRGRKFKVPFQLDLASRGYVAVSIEYRWNPESPFPAQIHDAKKALRWLKDNAARFGIDTTRMAAVGYSAGGNVASLLGLTRPDDGLEPDRDSSDGSPEVSLVVSCNGISDFASLYEQHCLAEPSTLARRYVRVVLDTFLGGPPTKFAELYRRASAISYVRRGAPPTLLIHSSDDPVIPPSQSRLLRDRLQKEGVKVRLEEVKGGHELYGPQEQAANKIILQFLEDNLKPRR
jgi:acetyl esterase/lipase